MKTSMKTLISILVVVCVNFTPAIYANTISKSIEPAVVDKLPAKEFVKVQVRYIKDGKKLTTQAYVIKDKVDDLSKAKNIEMDRVPVGGCTNGSSGDICN